MDFLGLTCQVSRTTNEVNILFSWLKDQDLHQLPLPVHVIDVHFMTLAARQMLKPWESNWSGKLPKNLELQDLMQILRVATWTILGDGHFRPLVFGRQQNWQDKLGSLPAHHGVLTIHLVHPQEGGGAGTGSKGGFRQQMQNALATTLLEEGHDLQWTTQAVDDILKKMGTKNLSQLMAASHTTRLQCALKALQDCDIDVPKPIRRDLPKERRSPHSRCLLITGCWRDL